ncbi:endothelin-converting enzyme homolog isoform X2 [Chrysoperla carnea]|uniref:endothelin-converting enzyme homolog isoform X2 n=1 Tax=Chrysoperla carnea TaxID=189513 RepID=UPI001D05C601|nr:endothelin-converting enzyme homolog isoform X2 [Chrysoperla carnea]
MIVKMTRYKHTGFKDEDSLSCGTVQLTEGISTSATHIRYHTRGSLWRTRTSLEKVLLIILACLLVITLLLTCLLTSSKNNYKIQISNINQQTIQGHQTNHGQLTGADQQYCFTAPCIHASSDILKGLDQSVDPCENFYEYACNGWVKENPIPEGKPMWGTFAKLEQHNQLIVKNALAKVEEDLKSKAEKKAKIYYESCMDSEDVIEKLGAEPMINLLTKLGGWNLTHSGFNLSKWNLQKSLQEVQNRYNMGGLFNWEVGEDDRNSSRHIIQIDQGGLTLPTRDYYLNITGHAKILDAYEEYMVKVASLLDPTITDINGTIRPQVKEIIQFETRLAAIFSPAEQRRDEERMYHNMSLADLDEKAPFISWTDYFSDAFKQVGKKITSKEIVVVYAPEYLQNLTVIIREYNGTKKGQIALSNYVMWQTVKSLTPSLSREFRDAYKPLRKVLIGSDGGEETWRYCVQETSNVLGFAVAAMFVRLNNASKPKPLAEKIISEVREAFKENLKHLDWMDAETRKAAMEKADGISDMIGYPDYILKPKQLDEKYAGLAVRRDEYFSNNIRVNQFNLKKNLEKLNQPVNKSEWGMTPHTVNAYYTPTKNQIVFPAGILQRPFFDINNPTSLNLGAMGVIMGHELTHAFDDEGREYDTKGNLNRWWKNATIERFKQKTACFRKQYDKYEINNKHVNGIQTLGENMADNGGLRAAYHAYLKWEAEQLQKNATNGNSIVETMLPLPGLNLTHRQLFFVSFAQVWCSVVTEEATNLLIEKDSHTPAKYRVIGSLSNFKEFSEQFGCKPNTYMNPESKCEVW